MPQFEMLNWTAFLAMSSLVLLGYLLFQGKQDRLDSRLQNLAGKDETALIPHTMTQRALSALPIMGGSLLPDEGEDRTNLQTRLIQAGYYGPQALGIFLGLKVLMTIGPTLLGLAAGLAGVVPVSKGLIFGALLGIFGMIGPSFWLDKRKKDRQQAFRRALPDALDIMVICLEGGLSLPAAIRRLGSELRTAHPGLATEMLIIQQEIQLGRTAGDALRLFAERCDLEEIRGLAAVVNQSERFGASLVKSMRVHAETMRGKRMQYAEEMAQKAAIKILFPTLLCIFPSIFVVILGPAVINIMEVFGNMKR